MNRYYKKRLAETWQALLGPPPVGRQPKEGGAAGETEDIATAGMREVAAAAREAYAELSGGVRATSVAPARKAAFLAAHPDAAHFTAQVGAACRAAGAKEPGFSADLGAALGRVLAYGEYAEMARRSGLADLSRSLDAKLGADGRAVLEVLRKDPRAVAGMNQALPWLRAMAIVERERMDPVEMLAAMEKFGPLDWRHPQSHALYWAWLGSRRAESPDPQTKINNDRIIVAGTQGLMDAGRLFYDPVEDFLSDQPDPRFIASYDAAQQFVRKRVANHEYAQDKSLGASFDRGEENFLHRAIQTAFLFGDAAQAQTYFRRVKEKFPNSAVYSRYYHLALPDFVVVTIREDSLRVVQEAALMGLLSRGLEAAFLDQDPGRAQMLFKMAEATREGIAKDHAEASRAVNGTADARRPVPPMAQLQEQALTRFLTDPGHTLRQRAIVWMQLPVSVRQMLFDTLEALVYPQVKASGLPVPPEVYFPPPEGLAEYRKARAAKAGGGGIVAPDRK